MTVISHYGVFLSGGVPYIHQQEDGLGEDVFGLGIASPFTMDILPELKRTGCPHDISLHPSEPVLSLTSEFLNNELVNIFLPKPNLGTPPALGYIQSKGIEAFPILKKLSELSSLNTRATVVFEKDREEAYRNQLRLTNLGPLSLVGVGVPQSMPIYSLSEFARVCHRNLIIAGHPDIPLPAGMQDLTASFNAAAQLLSELPRGINLRECGAWFFRKFMEVHYEAQGQQENEGLSDIHPPSTGVVD